MIEKAAITKSILLCLTFLSCTEVYGQAEDRASQASSMANDSVAIDSILHSLPEVMVTGERPVVKAEGNKLVYDVKQLLKNRGAENAYEAISELPGISEQGGTYNLAGQTVTVLLNDQKLTLSAEQMTALLKSIPASRVKHAEVLYTTPAKYQVRGAVINLQISQAGNSQDGLQGEATAAWNQSHNAMFSERGSLVYMKGKLTTDMLYQHNHGETYNTVKETAHHSLDDGSMHDMNTFQRTPSRNHEHIWRLGMNYTWADNHKLSFAYNGSYLTKHSHESFAGNINGLTKYNFENSLHDLSLNYQLPIGTKLGVEYTHYHAPRQTSLSSKLPTGSLNFDTNERQTINRWKFDITQEHDLTEKLSVNYGAYYTTSSDHSWQKFIETGVNTAVSLTDAYSQQREHTVNIFGGLDWNVLKTISLSASLAGEYYHTSVWNEWNLYPTLSLSYAPNTTHYLQLSLSNDKSYPPYWAVKNFITYSNGGYNEVVGNPNLKPSNTMQLQMVYLLHRKYQFVMWYNQANDYFTQTPYQRHDRLTVAYKYLNFNYQRQLGFNVSLPFDIVKQIWNTRLSLLGVYQQERCDDYYDLPFNRHIWWGMVNWRNSFTIVPGHLTAYLDGMVRTKAIQAIYDLPHSSNVNIGVRYKFWKNKALLHVFCNDLFQKNGIDPEIDYKGQNMKMDFSCYRTVGVSFTYTFGGYQEKQHKKVDTSRFKQ